MFINYTDGSRVFYKLGRAMLVAFFSVVILCAFVNISYCASSQNTRSGNVDRSADVSETSHPDYIVLSDDSLDYSSLGQIIVFLLFVILLIFFWNRKLNRFNLALKAEVARRRRLESVQNSLYEIALAVTAVSDMEEFYKILQHHLNEFVYADNFYIAFYDSESDILSFPYLTTTVEPVPPPRRLANGLTDYVVSTGEPLLADEAKQQELISCGDIVARGAPAACWLGVPLTHEGKTVGVISVQSYENADLLGEDDLDVLLFISPYIGLALDRLRLHELGQAQTLALKESEERFRTLFEESSDAVVLLDDMKIIQCNRAAYRILGMDSRDDLVGRSPWDISPEFQSDGISSIEKAIEIHKGALFRGSASFEWDLKKVDGEILYVEILITSVIYKGKDLFHVVWRDIAERKKAEAALSEREIKYRALFDHASDAIILMSLNGQFISANPEALSMFRVSSEDDFKSFRPEALMPKFQPNGLLSTVSLAANIQTAIDLGSLEYEGVGKRIDGEEFYLNIRLRILVVNGETLLLGTLRDITEKRVGREEIERSVSLLEATIESSTDGILAVDGYGLVVAWNSRFADMWDIPEQILNDGIVSDIFGYIVDQVSGSDFVQESLWDYSFESEHNYIDELVLKDGRIIERYSNPQRVGYEVVGRVWNFRDITDRRLSKIALEESHHRLNNIIEFLPDPTMVVDAEGVVVAWNNAIEGVTGVLKGDIIGKGDLEYSLPFHNERKPILIDLAISSGKEISTDMYDSFQRKGDMLYAEMYTPYVFGGKGAYLWGIACPLRDGAGKIFGAIECMRNVTDRRNVEKELYRAKLSAEAATRAKSEFLANISHEIRTPMNSIVGLGHLVLNSKLNATQRETLDKMMSSADSLLSIIENLLDFSKVEAGKLVLEQIEFKLDDVLNKLCNLVAVKADQKGLNFVLSVAPDVPHNLIGDPLRLEQILTNLTNNAIKFTGEGEVILLISCIKLTGSDVRLRFVVNDSGIGLSKEEIMDLFQSFTQADASTTRRFGGTGLGLAISKNLVSLMDGDIRVSSEHGKGSSFEFDASFKVSESQPDLVIPSFAQGMRVLLVDGNPISGKFIADYLRSFSFDVFSEYSVTEGLELLKNSLIGEDHIGLIIVDLDLPDIDGLEFSRVIRSISEFSKIPIILMISVVSSENVRMKARLNGVNGFIVKPATRLALYQAVNNVLKLGAEKYPSIAIPVSKRLAPSELEGREIHVLLVEDNELNQQVACKMLESLGVIVTVAGNGRKALEALWSKPYDIVLMDIQMPEMDGFTATKIIRSDEQYKDLPILAMTAHAMQGDREKSLEAGMNDHIVKPISPTALLDVLKKHVRSTEFNYVPMTDADQNRIVIPELQGIDTAQGIRNVGGNKKGYLRILRGFLNDYSSFADELRILINKSEFEKALVRVHTLKGVSGNIGANGIYELCCTIEVDLQYFEDKISSAVLDDFDLALASVINGLNSLGEAANVGNSKYTQDKEKSFELVNKLYTLLEEGNADSHDVLEELKEYLDPELFANDIQELTEYIDNYDFDECCIVIERISAELGMILRKRK